MQKKYISFNFILLYAFYIINIHKYYIFYSISFDNNNINFRIFIILIFLCETICFKIVRI